MTNSSQQVAITGNTYPVKDSIRALGGRWNAAAKAWMVPAQVADQARALVGSAPSATYQVSVSRGIRESVRDTAQRSRHRGTWTGCRCGSIEENPRDSDCASCQHDA